MNVDSFSTFEFRPRFSFNFNDSEKSDSSATMAGDDARTLVNRSRNTAINNGQSYEFNGTLVYNHKFKSHPGRSYSVNVRYQFSDVSEDGRTNTDNTYYLVDGEG